MKTFTEFLKDSHAGDYTGTDDNMPDDFDKWLTDLQVDELIDYADLWGSEIESELVKNAKHISININ